MVEDEKDPRGSPTGTKAESAAASTAAGAHAKRSQKGRAGQAERPSPEEVLRQSTAFTLPEQFERSLARMQRELRGMSAIEDALRSSSLVMPHEHLQRSLAELHKQLDLGSAIDQAFRKSSWGIRESMEQSLATISRQLRMALGLEGELAHSIRSAQEQLQRTFTTIQKPFQALTALQEALARSPAFTLQEQLQRSFVPLDAALRVSVLPQLQQTLEKADLSKVFAALERADVTHVLEQFASLSEIERYASASFTVAPDGSVLLDGELARSEEVQRALSDFFAQPEHFLSDLRSSLERLRKPIRAVLFYLLDRIFWMVLGIVIQPYIDRTTMLQIREIQREIRIENVQTRRELGQALRRSEASRLTPGEWRVVIGDGLRVRARPRKNARILDHLRLGRVVRRVQKQGRWILIEFEEPGTETLARGWVHSKYLRRISVPAGRPEPPDLCEEEVGQ